MKNYIYILVFFSMLFSACKDPNATGPGTIEVINEKVEYEVIEIGEFGLELDDITEKVIRNRDDLNSIITNVNYAANPAFFDRIDKINFENYTLVIISGRSFAEQTRITLDTIFVDANGELQLDYRVFRKLGISQKAFYPSLVVLIKNSKRQGINFRRKDMIEGEAPQFDGYQTIATDVPVNKRRKWKSVFRSENEFKAWAEEFNVTETDFIEEVDFETEIVISVGTGYFTSGDYTYKIQDISQQGNRLVVSSVFSVIDANVDLKKPNNHFIKIKRTNLSITFTPSFIFNIVNPNKEFYYEDFRLINLEAEEETKESVNKVSSLSELFSVMRPSNDLATNTEIDFEFFDILVIKSPTQKVRTLKYEIGNIKRDNTGIAGRVNFFPEIISNSQKIDTYVLIKILKTNIPISENFEVIIK